VRRLKVDPASPDPVSIAAAAAVLRAGGLVAFPTETVYGLGADALDPAAVRRIYEAKGRPAFNPIIVHVAGEEHARRLTRRWPAAATRLAHRFWPGPLTIVLPKDVSVPDIVTAGLDAVGIRVPAHPVALALIRAADLPVAAPSANRFTQVSPTTAEHVAHSLGDRLDILLDGGSARVGIESTVIDLSAGVPTVLRPGMISIDDLREVLGRVDMAKSNPADGVARPSPGMMDRHYSPAATLRVSEAGAEATADMARAEARTGGKTVILARSPIAGPITVWRMPDTPGEFARVLYGMLHQADADGYQVVIVEGVPDGAAWDGVRDRLRRAAQ
jgi:L-threonylcarbamoyladenylate synthase